MGGGRDPLIRRVSLDLWLFCLLSKSPLLLGDMADDEEEKPEGSGGETEGEESAAKPANEKSGDEADDIADAISDDDDIAADGDESALKNMGSVDEIDDLLDEVDPEFKKSLEDIKGEDFANHNIDSSQTEQNSDSKEVRSLRIQFIHNLPLEHKIIYGGFIAIALFFVPLIILVANRTLIPTFELPYILSFKELTERIYSYDPEGTKVPLFDDFRSKSHTMALPQTVINLRSEAGQPAFGRFEFFLNVRDKELASIIETKQSEIIDLIQRTLEQVSWQGDAKPFRQRKGQKSYSLSDQRVLSKQYYYRRLLPIDYSQQITFPLGL